MRIALPLQAHRLVFILPALLLGGCVTTHNGMAIRPSLPPAPSGFGEQVPVPAAVAGVDARQYAAEVVGVARSANRRLANDRAFYEDLRKKLK